MASTETVWDNSIKARTDLIRRQSCALGVSVIPIDQISECHTLDRYQPGNAFPPQDGKVLLHLHWPLVFRVLLKGQDAGQDAHVLLLSLTSPAVDQVASVKLLWPPDLGGATPPSDCQALGFTTGTRYPSNECIVAYNTD
eukprot:2583603-Pyramimonas_sp.AAC.1